MPATNDVYRILSAIEQGDPHAAEQLLPLVYDELRKPAAHKAGLLRVQKPFGNGLCANSGWFQLDEIRPI